MSLSSGSPDVLVVGGGVAGCSVAWFAVREGLSVTLLERDEVAAHASGAAAGMLAPLVEGARDGVEGAAGGSGAGLQRWGLRALECLPSLCAELKERSGIDAEYEPSGLLRVALDPATAAELRTRAGSFDLEWLDARDARDAEPLLAEDVSGALWSPREAHVRSPLLSRAYAASAAALGAHVESGVRVKGLLREGDRITGVRTERGAIAAGHVVVCTGCWARDLLEWLPAGVAAPPVEPVRGQILSLDSPRPPLRSIVWGRSAYLVPKRDGSVVVGATEEHVGFDCRVTVAGMRDLLAAAPRLVPALAETGFRAGWAGLRPVSPDGLPLIGPVGGFTGLTIAVGHSRNGVLLSPVTGELVAARLCGKEHPADAAIFDPGRFEGVQS